MHRAMAHRAMARLRAWWALVLCVSVILSVATQTFGQPVPGAAAPGVAPTGAAPGAAQPGVAPVEPRYAVLKGKSVAESKEEVENFDLNYINNRRYRGFCMCNAGMFSLAPSEDWANMCFADLARACWGREMNKTPEEVGIFDSDFCSELQALDDTSMSTAFLNRMDFEVKRKCKHPYRINDQEMQGFFENAVGAPPEVLAIMQNAGFDGKMFSEITEEHAQYLGFPLEFYKGEQSDLICCEQTINRSISSRSIHRSIR